MPPIRPLILPSPSQYETLPGLQLLRANLGFQGANEFLNNMYNIVQYHNSQEIEESLLCLEEILYNAPPRGNSIKEAISRRTQTFVPEITSTKKDEAPKSNNLERIKE